MHERYLAAVQDSSGVDLSVLLQYGAVGVIAVIALWVARLFYNKLLAAWERERVDLIADKKAEKDRADRLESALEELNKTMRDQVMGVLAEAQRTVAESINRIR